MKLPKNWKKILSMALFIVLVGLLGWYLYRHWDEMRELLALDGRTVTLLILFALCGCVMNLPQHSFCDTTAADHQPVTCVQIGKAE